MPQKKDTIDQPPMSFGDYSVPGGVCAGIILPDLTSADLFNLSLVNKNFFNAVNTALKQKRDEATNCESLNQLFFYIENHDFALFKLAYEAQKEHLTTPSIFKQLFNKASEYNDGNSSSREFINFLLTEAELNCLPKKLPGSLSLEKAISSENYWAIRSLIRCGEDCDASTISLNDMPALSMQAIIDASLEQVEKIRIFIKAVLEEFSFLSTITFFGTNSSLTFKNELLTLLKELDRLDLTLTSNKTNFKTKEKIIENLFENEIYQATSVYFKLHQAFNQYFDSVETSKVANNPVIAMFVINKGVASARYLGTPDEVKLLLDKHCALHQRNLKKKI